MAVFSQWYPLGFENDNQSYPTAEHWMMAERARLFGDDNALEQILEAKDPGKAKALGRGVRGFDSDIWDQRAFGIVIQGNMHKFTQNPEACDVLMRTGSMIIAEASPIDNLWGIGLS
ncbi:MAG: NADAR family protein, partial [Pseudomonadota bacterium]